MEFRAEGRLGCPHDYEAFAAGLQPILKRLHEATRHVGKTVRRRRIADARPILRLRTKLRQAVEREDFEQAARLRDMLKTSTAGDIA
jgi:protein arginine kinase activator